MEETFPVRHKTNKNRIHLKKFNDRSEPTVSTTSVLHDVIWKIILLITSLPYNSMPCSLYCSPCSSSCPATPHYHHTSVLLPPYQQGHCSTTMVRRKMLQFLAAAKWRAGEHLFASFLWQNWGEIVINNFRLIGSVFRIFANEVLGYDVSLVLHPGQVTVADRDRQFKQLSSCKNAL